MEESKIAIEPISLSGGFTFFLSPYFFVFLCKVRARSNFSGLVQSIQESQLQPSPDLPSTPLTASSLTLYSLRTTQTLSRGLPARLLRKMTHHFRQTLLLTTTLVVTLSTSKSPLTTQKLDRLCHTVYVFIYAVVYYDGGDAKAKQLY